ncbi:hypothetical protein [Acidocella sp.]|uniref:hypothetical protein n=1 Tax=Acidocella sp. TaxID=50710 RepID=UPI00261A4B5E|nr:hypothetical protein [Acidocella sp.]
MSDIVLFKMWEPFRQSLIDGHLFYVEQANKRLLSQFDDIEEESKAAYEEWLKRNAHRFDPDRHDPADFEEAAYDASNEFYLLLSDMREQTVLSVVAGMFHEWDKKLRDWLAIEIRHWHSGDRAVGKFWSVDFGKIIDFLECLGWNIRDESWFNKLNACRLVVNVYKHGAGNALDDLKRNHPEYIDDPLKGSSGLLSKMDYIDHTHLQVSRDKFRAFSDSIVEFWRGIPDNIFSSRVVTLPDWFEKAIQEDRGGQRKSGTP